MKQSYAYMVCIYLFFSFSNILYTKNSKQPQANKNFLIKPPFCMISRDCLLNYIFSYPLTTSCIAAGTAASYLYPDKLESMKDWIYANRNTVFAATVCSLGLTYYHRTHIQDWFFNSSDDEEESKSSYDSFSESNVQIYLPKTIKTTFADVAGLESAKESLKDIFLFLQEPEKFITIGAKIPKGILFSGAPGNGKTLLARALAGESQCPFLYVNSSSFIEAFVGVGAARVRHLFEIAKKLAPCIIFFDEIDSIGRKRMLSATSSDSDFSQTLNQLLAELDGFEQNENPIIVIAATNRANVLDEALTRPGRFDRHIEINAPFLGDRVEILKVHLQNVVTDENINIEKIACATYGFSAAELANLVNEAAICAVKNNRTYITMADIDQARDIMLMGHELKGMTITDQELYKTAIHESGHALARVLQSDATPLYKITITPRGSALGLTFGMDTKEYYNSTENELKAEIRVALAGSVAEEIIFGYRDTGICSDLTKARELATAMVMRYGMSSEFKDVSFEEFMHTQFQLPNDIASKIQQEIANIISQCRQEIIEILDDHKTELLQLAKILMKEKTVSGDIVYDLCNIAQPAIEFSLE